MKPTPRFTTVLFLLSAAFAKTGLAQDALVASDPLAPHRVAESRAGTWYAYWGWNEDRYTRGDIRFRGAGYDFTVKKARGVQRQYPFTVNEFLNPATVTIPQFNFRIGKFVRDDLEFSVGLDHMKWVLDENQEVAVEGVIAGTGTEHDGVYNGETKIVTRDWLAFEHTDGLNWFNVAARKHQTVFAHKWLSLSAFEGAEVGIVTPRTDATLFGGERHDKYRLAGYAVGGSLGLNLTLWRYFFLQSELKGGFVHLPSARTTPDPVDRASHAFFFGQAVAVFGGRWRFNKAGRVGE